MSTEYIVYQIGKEIRILEITEQQQIDANAQHQPGFSSERMGAGMYLLGNQEVGNGAKQENEQTDAAGLVVEKGAGSEKKEITEQQLVVQQAEHRKNQGKEGPEIELRKQQGGLRIETEIFQ